MSKDIFVFMEQRDGKLLPVGLELLGEAARLASKRGGRTAGVLLGCGISGLAQEALERGADRVLAVDSPYLEHYATEPYAKAMTQMIREEEPDIVLFGATTTGRDLAPRVAARIGSGLTADCTGLDIEEETGLLQMTKPAFSGSIMAVIVCREKRPQMASVRPGIMAMAEKRENPRGRVEWVDVPLSAADMPVEILEVVKEERAGQDMARAKVLAAGGRGIGGPEGLKLLGEVAGLLGGQVAASRACVEEGWISADRQVGQTGTTVRPDLYLACGISGQAQHTAGMEKSDLIIAINQSEAAPIFNLADLGIVGDVKVILPKLKDALENYAKER